MLSLMTLYDHCPQFLTLLGQLSRHNLSNICRHRLTPAVSEIISAQPKLEIYVGVDIFLDVRLDIFRW